MFLFAGHHIVAAVLDELDSMQVSRGENQEAQAASLKLAAEIVVTGESAGGAAVYTNLDHIASRYPGAAVAGAAIAGFNNFAFPYTGPGHTDLGPADPKWVDFRKPAWGAIQESWDPLLNEQCAAKYADYNATCLVGRAPA
jgi:hypothetical protein